ncbi:hypothetical protein [Teredinibacter turnerae]|uniref:hypothetical protein n=1 Tax=Teredinibacter turnerae TaxID=2426 RepID=UPI00040CCC6B|nr:hypothetical protein [Teredinibacter turnerae]
MNNTHLLITASLSAPRNQLAAAIDAFVTCEIFGINANLVFFCNTEATSHANVKYVVERCGEIADKPFDWVWETTHVEPTLLDPFPCPPLTPGQFRAIAAASEHYLDF